MNQSPILRIFLSIGYYRILVFLCEETLSFYNIVLLDTNIFDSVQEYFKNTDFHFDRPAILLSRWLLL